MRVLKTKYPCKHCGEPAEVESKRAAQWASCDRCSERHSAISRWHWTEEVAAREAKRANEMEDDSERLAAWSKVTAKSLEGIAARIKGAPVLTPAERRRVANDTRSRFRRVRENLKILAPLMDEFAESMSGGLEILSGEAVASDVPAPTLRLVRGSCGQVKP